MKVTYEEILERLLEHLRKMVTEHQIVDESTDLVEGLGLDSFKVLDLLLEVEDEFDISVPMNVLTDVRTVKDLAECVLKIANESS